MLRTRVGELLGIEIPILNAPMGGGYARAALAAAVSNAGGLGMIGGTTSGGPEWLLRQIRRLRDVTDRPFGVGFISHRPGADALMEAALAERVPVIAHSFADPSPYVPDAHAAGALVICQVRTLEGAVEAARAGVDIVVAQGTEAGGHTGLVSTMPLIPAVVDAVAPIPVIAAGGIADGRGIAAALMLGAEGVWLGTRFVATPESGYPDAKKERVLAAGMSDTVLTAVHDIADEMPWPAGVLGRSVRNAFAERWHGREAELRDWIASSRDTHAAHQAANDPDETSLYGGEACGLISSLEPAGDLVRRLAAEAEATLRARLAAVLDPAGSGTGPH